jgi:hypothetical protein
VAERPKGSVSGDLLLPLGLIRTVSEYSQRHGIRFGLAVVKQRLLRALSRRVFRSPRSPAPCSSTRRTARQGPATIATRTQGKRPKAHELLAEVYAWFTEGFDTADFQEAKALLGELA